MQPFLPGDLGVEESLERLELGVLRQRVDLGALVAGPAGGQRVVGLGLGELVREIG